MGVKSSAPRNWENERALSELVLARSRVAAAQRAEERRNDLVVAALRGSLSHRGLTDVEMRAAASAVLRTLDAADEGDQGSTRPRRIA